MNTFGMECNLCGGRTFIDMNKRKNVKCKDCGSVERTRILGLFLKQKQLVKPGSKVMHIAPEKGVSDFLLSITKDTCDFYDLDPSLYPYAPGIKKMDLCKDLEMIPSGYYDIIIHNHVLEHLPCNYTYVLYHFDRILAPNGSMIFSVPILGGKFASDFSSDLTDEERTVKFGQFDHMRKFGREDIENSLGKVYKKDFRNYTLVNDFDRKSLMTFNIPESLWNGLSSSSIHFIKKGDFRLI